MAIHTTLCLESLPLPIYKVKTNKYKISLLLHKTVLRNSNIYDAVVVCHTDSLSKPHKPQLKQNIIVLYVICLISALYRVIKEILVLLD